MKTLFVEVILKNKTVLRVPYWEVDSGIDGPTLLTMACQHGNELNGCIAIRDFTHAINGKLKKGKVISIPFANPLALHTRQAHLDLGPEQAYLDSKHNMQMLWGKSNSNDTALIAEALWDTVVSQATHIVDIHCYPKFAAPLIQIHHSKETEALARVMGFPFIRFIPQGDDWEGSIRIHGQKTGKIVVGLELSGQYELFENEIARGENALLNLAKHLNMLPRQPGCTESPVIIKKLIEIRTPHTGLFVKQPISLGSFIRRGDKLGYILSDATLEENWLTASVDGYLIRFVGRENSDVSLTGHHQYVYENDNIASISSDI